eukprot:gene3597-6332_t
MFLKKKNLISKISYSLYKGHIPTSCFQKTALAAGSAFLGFLDPTRDHCIAILGETTGYPSLKYLQNKMKSSEEGREILKEKPRVNEILNPEKFSNEYLSGLPKNTLGYSYFKYMNINGFKASERAKVKFVDDVELAYVMTRYREIHDFYHVLSDLPPSVYGEIVVKWIEMMQTGLPMTMLSSFVGPLLLKNEEKIKLARDFVPYASKVALNSKNLMTIYFEKYLEQDVDEFRKSINFPKCEIKIDVN